MRKLAVSAAIAAAFAPGIAGATNGMNMEGYGPVATGMGGASMAYDNGTAALMNNPATLALMPQGSRLDLALGFLGPNVTSSVPGMPEAKSSGDAYYMPAVGWVTKRGSFTTGVGVFAQGGMGTEYSSNSFMSAGSAMTTRSEVSVGRLMVPLAYDVSPSVKVGGSLDYVWAGMDVQMAMPGGAMIDMLPPAMGFGSTQTYGSLSGSLVTGLGNAIAGGQIGGLNWGYFDFSNTSKFTGQATGKGYAGKLGVVYEVSPQLSIGAAYHLKTQLGDLEAGSAKVSMNVVSGATPPPGFPPTGTSFTLPLTGSITVKDFQWPDTYGVGLAYQARSDLMLVADYKRINWSKVMKDFKMTFTADGNPANGNFAGASMDAVLYQNWKDQNVIMIGAAFKADAELTWRVGANLASNPVPDQYMHPLFPAIVKNHYTGGFGYAFSKASTFDFSLTVAPEVSATNGSGVTTKHSQFNWQAMYSQRF